MGLAAASTAGFYLTPGCVALQKQARQKTKPNIIFILADDLGYGDLGCYGQKKIKTPNIDRMAGEGMKFTQFYAGSTVCAPSRCSLVTGLHTGHCRIRGNSPGLLTDEDVTVGEVLKRAGYHTGIIGKWGVGHPPPPGDPAGNGFEYFFGYLNMVHAHNYYPEYLWRNSKKVKLPGNKLAPPKNDEQGWSYKQHTYSHDLFTKDALCFIEKNRENPFFLYLAYTIPHANNEGERYIGDGMEVPDYGRYKKKAWPYPERGKAAMITRMDRDLGRVIDKLKKLGIDNNTIVFFSSDNGPHTEGGIEPEFFNSSGPLRGVKRDLYEGGIRVPFIARWPGTIMPGTQSDYIGAFWDFLPSAADLAGQKPPKNTDGISIVPTLLGRAEKQKKHHALYWEFHERGGKQAVRMGKFKAVRLDWHKNPDNPIELYNLEEDLAEQNNIAEGHPDITAKMEEYLKNARKSSAQYPLAKEQLK